MQRLKQLITKSRSWRAAGWRICRDLRGQDLIEYALMTAVVAVASAAVLPSATTSLGTIFSKVTSVLSVAGAS